MDFEIKPFNSTTAVAICFLDGAFGEALMVRRRWKMNPGAFMLLDRLEKLMCSPQSQHPSNSFLGPVASMSGGWKGTLLKFGGRSGRWPSSPRGHILCPIKLISVWMADLPNPETWLALYACTFWLRPLWSPWPPAFYVDVSGPCQEIWAHCWGVTECVDLLTI